MQIGAVKLNLYAPFDILEQTKIYITPTDRNGAPVALDPFFTNLTGITQADLDAYGKPLAHALQDFATFAGKASIWSWGKDEHNLMATSCYMAGIPPPIPPTQFDNVCILMLRAGMPYDDIKRTRSPALAAYFGLELPPGPAHDGLSDALSITYALQHVLATGRLSAQDFRPGAPVPISI